ncbi:MAG: hypothetical protein KDK64_06200 [Chlamydiia bacterium]|nr:hypothetical protein [Chlamydiia bacterium]
MNQFCKVFSIVSLFSTLALFGDATSNSIVTPPMGPLCNHQLDIAVDAEFLYWFSNISNLSYAVEGEASLIGESGNPVLAGRTTFVPIKNRQLDRSWDPGSRIGLGLVMDHDGWDVYSDWTYFYNSETASRSVPPFSNPNFAFGGNNQTPGVKALRSPWFLTPNGDFFNHIQSKWAVLFNQIDLELGRNYLISKYLSLRPYAGVRGYWTRMHFSVKGSRPFLGDTSELRSSSRYRQKNWGVGFLAGLDTNWFFTVQWSLFADASAALTYGKWWVKRASSERERDTTGVIRNLRVNTRDINYGIQPFVDLVAGLRWQNAYTNFRLLFDAGWEFHYLVDINQMFRGTGETIANSDLLSTNGNLTLSGIRIRGRVEF